MRRTFPDTVRAVVTSRVDRLPAELRSLLRSAAVLGRSFETGLLEQLNGYGPVSEALDQLAATRLVERAGRDRYRFAHALTREAVYEGIPLAERRRLHKEAAGALADVQGAAASSLPAIAYHLALAQDWEAAASALVAAGEQAARIASDDEALEMYRAAIAAHERLAEDRWTPLDRSRIDRQMAEALRRLGRNEEALRQIAGALTRLGVRLPGTTRPSSGRCSGSCCRGCCGRLRSLLSTRPSARSRSRSTGSCPPSSGSRTSRTST